MKRDDRKKLTANEMYLNECMSILYTKIKANVMGLLKEGGDISDKYLVNVENYQHGTVTYACKPNVIKVNYDGSNFAPTFKMDVENGGFMYKLKPLGIEYVYKDKPLDEMVHEKRVFRSVGKCQEYYRYLSCETFFILLEYYSIDGDEKTVVINSKAKDYNDNALMEYLYEEKRKAEMLDLELNGDDELDSEIEDDNSLDFDYIEEELRTTFNKRELEEIDAYSSDDVDGDICTIDYSLSEILKDKVTEAPYKSEYPENIEDFDYQEYIKGIESYTEVNTNEGSSKIEAYSAEDFSDEDNDYEYGDEEQDYDEDLDEELFSAMDTISNEEGFIEDGIFDVKVNNEVVEGPLKNDIVDNSAIGVMDLDKEVITLKDFYVDMDTELRKMKAIVIRRNERVMSGNKRNNNRNLSVDSKEDKKDLDLD